MPDTCSTCGGGGIVPAANCTCTVVPGKSGHICISRVCPDCEGSGQR